MSLNYNTETVRSFVQGEVLFQDDLPNNEFTTRFYDDGRVIKSQVPENREQTHYITRLGSDWTVDDTNIVIDLRDLRLRNAYGPRAGSVYPGGYR